MLIFIKKCPENGTLFYEYYAPVNVSQENHQPLTSKNK